MRTQNPDLGIEPFRELDSADLPVSLDAQQRVLTEEGATGPQESAGDDGVVSCLIQTRAALEQALPALQRDDGPSLRRYGKRGSTTRFFLK